MDDNALRQLLRTTRVIAVVGLSDDPARPSYSVARYLQAQGYQIVPINPDVSEVLGEAAYPDLASVPVEIDLVDIFRRADAVGPHVDEAIQKGTKAVWLQLGIRNDAALQKAERHGLQAVQDLCIAVEHRRLIG